MPTPIALPLRRGLQPPFASDYSLFVLLVHSDLEKLIPHFMREIRAHRWAKNVVRRALPECELDASVYYPFQLSGHSWSTIIHRLDSKGRFGVGLCKRLSASLAERVIFAGDHDTAGTVDYILFDSGKLSEVFHWSKLVEFHSLSSGELAQIERDGFLRPPYGYYAGSRVRDLNLNEFHVLNQKRGLQFRAQLEHLLDDFLTTQDAFVAFNVDDEPGTEYYPIAEAKDEMVRIDVVRE